MEKSCLAPVERETQKRPRFWHAQETMVRIAFQKLGVKGQGVKHSTIICAFTKWLPAQIKRAGPIRPNPQKMSKKAKIEDSYDDLTWGERREMEDNKPLFPFPREKLHTFFHSLPRAAGMLCLFNGNRDAYFNTTQ